MLSAILAYSRGFVREGLAIVGWIAAAVVAFMFAPAARPLIAQLPFLNKFLGDSCELATIGGSIAKRDCRTRVTTPDMANAHPENAKPALRRVWLEMAAPDGFQN